MYTLISIHLSRFNRYTVHYNLYTIKCVSIIYIPTIYNIERSFNPEI